MKTSSLALVAAMAGAQLAPCVVAARGVSYGAMAPSSIGAVGRPVRPVQLPSGPGAGAGIDRPVRPGVAAGVGYAGYGYRYAYGSASEDIEVEPAPPPPAPPDVPPPPPAAGTIVSSVPPGCSTVERNGTYLRSCGGALYREQFDGDQVVYEVVPP